LFGRPPQIRSSSGFLLFPIQVKRDG
jgi:hypothetical protein